MDNRGNNGGKNLFGMLKGKSATSSSAPSMAFRFNATAEEIEEVCTKEDEQKDTVGDSCLPVEKSAEVETSPRRSILPLLGKRSISVDVNSTNAQDSSPPSDPWRFLSDIKGKIKSVEEKFIEYKARTAETEGSPKIHKPIKDSKDNSSLSDSEEASESSISKTCGVISTTEGVEMSSDDETPSLSEEDKRNQESVPGPERSASDGIRQRYRLAGTESTDPKEGSLRSDFLENIQKMSEALDDDIEHGVEVLAEVNVANFEVDNENVLNINQVTGADIREAEFTGRDDLRTVFSPQGFVDLRREDSGEFSLTHLLYKSKVIGLALVLLGLYFLLPLSVYASGFIAGALVLSACWALYIKLYMSESHPRFELPLPHLTSSLHLPIVEIPSAKVHEPLTKYEGWMNEYPEEYNPLTYHVCQTQPVYLRLQGNFLKVSHTRHKIPKRAMWNEPEHKTSFTRHRIYNLFGAKVVLLPDGLARVRRWSKKYPMCIILNKEQIDYDEPVKKVKEHKGKEVRFPDPKTGSVVEIHRTQTSLATVPSEVSVADDVMQIYSKLVDNIDAQESTTSTCVKSSDSEVLYNVEDSDEFNAKLDLNDEDDEMSVFSEWHDVIPDPIEINPDETRIYLFGRTCREKEHWFRRLRLAAGHSMYDEDKEIVSEEYLTYMKLQKVIYGEDAGVDCKNKLNPEIAENSWLNALVARIFFDCAREPRTVQLVKERIQRKLHSIRLPYFIQELHCEQLSLGTSSPTIMATSKPYLNEKGLWCDMDIAYEGNVMLILQTKVNLLKLKVPQGDRTARDRPVGEKPAIYHSDIDDSAESSTDDDSQRTNSQTQKAVLDGMGYPVPGLGGASKGSKKLMMMVDRLADSKFFQAATDNKYIKKKMADFSNTDLRLRVDVKKCVGKLAINIPPPPSDRLWFGFRVPPELVISAQPIVGDRSISFMHVTSWIEKKIYKEFQKILVIPNMEDLCIPVMSPKLPE